MVTYFPEDKISSIYPDLQIQHPRLLMQCFFNMVINRLARSAVTVHITFAVFKLQHQI